MMAASANTTRIGNHGTSSVRSREIVENALQDNDAINCIGGDEYLRANSTAYEVLVDAARAQWRTGHIESTLHAVSRAAAFACTFHPGRFADGAIENIALEIGCNLRNEKQHARRRSTVAAIRKQRHVLHVLSHVLGVGGHTRMLYHWIRNDKTSRHSVAITSQGDREIPDWLSQAVAENGGGITVCPKNLSQYSRATLIRQKAHSESDLVVLHHDAGDVVPTVAFAVGGGPPVTVLNHADHLFWLGSSVCDMIINLRSVASEHSITRRFGTVSAVLPIPLNNYAPSLTKAEARKLLNVPEDWTVLLSIGRSVKYQPCGAHNFVATATRILEHNPAAHLIIIGATSDEIIPYVGKHIPERLHFVGEVRDTTIYRIAADLYLESFPFGSNTALLEAALSGLAVVPAYAPLFELLVAGNDALQDLLPNPPSQEAYVTRTCDLIRDVDDRIKFGQKLRRQLLESHVEEKWLEHLSRVYHLTDDIIHHSHAIPETKCETSDADIGLSFWNIIADGKTNHQNRAFFGENSILHHAAFVSKYAGDYAAARRFATEAVLNSPFSRQSWRLLCACILGPTLRAANNKVTSLRKVALDMG